MFDDHELLQLATKYNIQVVQLRKRFILDEEPVGSGAFGFVYAATDTSNNDRVAVKILNNYKLTEETVKEFNRVARIPKNDLVVNYREILVGRDTNGFPRLLVVMDLVVGNELFASIEAMSARNKTFKPAQLFNIFFNLASGLALIHDHGVAHKDIKPENVMIRTDGMPVLVDFGLACISDEDCKQRGTAGTRGYFPPEYWALGPDSKFNTLRGAQLGDMFALGCTFFTCMSFWNYSTFFTYAYGKDENVGSLMQLYRSLYSRGPERWNDMPVRGVPRDNQYLVTAIQQLMAVPEFYKATRGLLIMNPELRMGHDELLDVLKAYYDRVTSRKPEVPGPPPVDNPDDPPPPLPPSRRDTPRP